MSAIRLTFSVVSGKPEFTGAKRITMRVPPARNVERIDTEAGTWLEILDKSGNRLFASIVDPAVLSPMVEVRTGVGEPGLTMVKSKARQLLHVVVPDDKSAIGFRLMQRDKKSAKSKSILSGDL